MRLLALAVREARNRYRCDFEEPSYTDSDGGGYEPGQPACWKTHEWDHDNTPTDPGEWCKACLARQHWHIALCAIQRIHGGRLRRLQVAALAPEPTLPSQDNA